MVGSRWLLLLAFCLLSASDWVLPAYLPSALPQALHAAAAYALAGGAFGIAALRRSRTPEMGWAQAAKSAGQAGGLYILPPLVATLAAGRVSAGSSVLVFTLVPVAVILFEAQRASRFGAQGGRLTALPGALAGAAGAALLLPFSLPSSVPGKLCLAAIVAAGIVAALASVRLSLVLQGCSIPKTAALLCGIGALANAAVAGVSSRALSDLSLRAETEATLAAAAFTVAQVLLLLVLLRSLPPTVFAARYLLVPLIALAEGFALAHAALSPTVVAGFALLGAGGAMLVRSAGAQSDTPDSILL